MIHGLRTIRRLDERSETKEIAGVVIEKGIPVPSRVTQQVSRVLTVLRALEVGESFVAVRNERDHRLTVQKATGRKFVGRPLDGKRWRIWRVL